MRHSCNIPWSSYSDNINLQHEDCLNCLFFLYIQIFPEHIS